MWGVAQAAATAKHAVAVITVRVSAAERASVLALKADKRRFSAAFQKFKYSNAAFIAYLVALVATYCFASGIIFIFRFVDFCQ